MSEMKTNEAEDIIYTEDPQEPDTITGDIYELMRIRRVKGCIERLAYLFERYGLDHCQGDCDRPVTIAPMFPEAITCCNLQPVYLYHRQILGLESTLLTKIQKHKPRQPTSKIIKSLLIAAMSAGISAACALHHQIVGADMNITTTEAYMDSTS